jgi:hypothetical protein
VEQFDAAHNGTKKRMLMLEKHGEIKVVTALESVNEEKA